MLGYTVREFHETLHHIADGKLDVEPIVTHTPSGSTASRARSTISPGTDAHGKVIVRPWD